MVVRNANVDLPLAIGARVGGGPQLPDQVGDRVDLAHEAILPGLLFLNPVHDLLELPLPVHPAPPAGLVVEVPHAAILLILAQVLRDRSECNRVARQRRSTSAPVETRDFISHKSLLNLLSHTDGAARFYFFLSR